MTGTDPLPTEVLRLKAVIYIRQSTQAAYTESTRRQYELVDLARHQGFHEIEVIDDVRRSPSVGRPLESAPYHRLVDAMFGRQLCRRQLTAQRLKSNLRLEIRQIPLPLARHSGLSLSGANRA
jgi:hypothetical protein